MAALLAASLSLPPPSRAAMGGPESSWENQWYWYADIFDRFFGGTQGPGGRTAMEARRNGSRRTGFSKPKPAGGLRVFVVGGSMAAQYDDEDSPVRPRLVEVLSRLYPGRMVEVVYCGMPGYDSYRESLIVEEIVGHEPDLVVFMTGNNENLPVAGKPSTRVALAMQWRRLLHGRPPSLAALWRGLKPEGTISFEGRLREMIRLVKGKGAEAVVCTLPRLYGVMPDAPLPMWDEGFRAGWAEWERGRFRSAARLFRGYAAAHPGDLMARALLGGALERCGDFRGAHAVFHAGQDSDINGTLRRVAREEGAVLADLHDAFEAVSAAVLDPRNARLMRDGVHWERQADPLVSAAIARTLAAPAREGSFVGLRGAMDASWLDRDAASWERAAVRLHPVSTRDFHGRVMEALMESRNAGPGFSEATIASFERLHRRYPRESAGLDGQREAMLRIKGSPWAQARDDEFERRWTAGLACLGEAYRRMGLRPLAKRYFAASLARDPDAAWPRLGLALCHHAAGETRARLVPSRRRGEGSGQGGTGSRQGGGGLRIGDAPLSRASGDARRGFVRGPRRRPPTPFPRAAATPGLPILREGQALRA
ncbi:MAG: hypothetical protein HZB91_07055 [Elusimicrobia bacterium]|nr:hypothetical protein [Elusimicrobiota bacterium]